MAALVPGKLIQMASATDPRRAILEAIGSALNEIEVFGSQVLVGTYIESDRTSGGIWKPQKSIEESLWQGILGLVLKKGPWAFQNDDKLGIDWKGQDVQINDWVMFRYSSAWEFHLNGVSVRLVDDRDIRAVIADPSLLTSKPIAALGG